jgi:hypothetical protein
MSGVYDKDVLVEMLVDDEFNTIMEGDGQWILNSYLEHGFRGYRAYNYDELIQECNERGLLD